MAKFKKRTKETPGIQTSSLPDIVFMLIFFFMVATVIRQNSLLVKNLRPQASEVTKVQQKSLTEYLYMGSPVEREKYGDAPRLQLDDAFAQVGDVQAFVEAKRAETDPKLRTKITWSLKVDVDTRMGIVTEVKQELRKVEALKINYSANEALEE
ncbi:MAG: biopolymer transporter ExbD [Bacteroidia bacterium]